MFSVTVYVQCHSVSFSALTKRNKYNYVNITSQEHTLNVSVPSSVSQIRFIINPYPTAFPYGNGMVLHFYQQQESSTTKTVHKVINKGLKAYV